MGHSSRALVSTHKNVNAFKKSPEKRSSSLIESLTARLNLTRIQPNDTSKAVRLTPSNDVHALASSSSSLNSNTIETKSGGGLGSIFKNPLQITKKITNNAKDQVDSPNTNLSKKLPPTSPTNKASALSPSSLVSPNSGSVEQNNNQWVKANFSSLYGLDNEEETSPSQQQILTHPLVKKTSPPPAPPLPPPPPSCFSIPTQNATCSNEIFPNLSRVDYQFPNENSLSSSSCSENDENNGNTSSLVKPRRIPSAPPQVEVIASSNYHSGSSSVTTVVPSNYKAPSSLGTNRIVKMSTFKTYNDEDDDEKKKTWKSPVSPAQDKSFPSNNQTNITPKRNDGNNNDENDSTTNQNSPLLPRHYQSCPNLAEEMRKKLSSVETKSSSSSSTASTLSDSNDYDTQSSEENKLIDLEHRPRQQFKLDHLLDINPKKLFKNSKFRCRIHDIIDENGNF